MGHQGERTQLHGRCGGRFDGVGAAQSVRAIWAPIPAPLLSLVVTRLLLQYCHRAAPESIGSRTHAMVTTRLRDRQCVVLGVADRRKCSMHFADQPLLDTAFSASVLKHGETLQ